MSGLLRLLLSIALLFTPSVAWADTGKVIAVLDGDIIEVIHGHQVERIRLNGIDRPEKGQDYGQRAKRFTQELVEQKEVRVETRGLDKYGRTIGDVFLMDGTHVNRELVNAGLAWRFCRHSSDNQLKQLEEESREAKRGLWVDPVPIPPWVYRKLQRKQVPDVADFDCSGLPVPTALWNNCCQPRRRILDGGFSINSCSIENRGNLFSPRLLAPPRS
ncbi:Uncharacterized endonuclease (modular protein) [Nitrospira japonica]|uniref:Uncharacterized endonuclease (Modular protein) n=1 Tax=Nitrospira japonica TaxID=1325564 RepID=A0A1W1I527_9BACT|nr:thermonuclease family protein [Nitrospira japonica]SLM48100.1 Uncharacterized endonuclease (modular protein) [Nitrospira japonica]